jgi:Uma2 family endonuclease
MTAQPTGTDAHGMWPPDPMRQRRASYTVEDVLKLPADAPRVELRDGVMIVVPSPTLGHQDIGYLLWQWFRMNAPPHLRPSGATGVLVGLKDALEPDVLLLNAETVVLDRHYSTADQVVIAVEVVSPGTKKRDRLEKPAEYAAAGVPFYWRIEQNPVHVFAYELGADGAYTLVTDSTEELVVEKPFEIRLPISEITP